MDVNELANGKKMYKLRGAYPVHDRVIDVWERTDNAEIAFALSNRGDTLLALPRTEFVALVRAMGIASGRSFEKLAEAEEKLAGVKAVMKEFERAKRQAGSLSLVQAYAWVLERLSAALDDPKLELTLPTEAGSGIKARNKNNPGVEEFRKLSDGTWVSRVCAYRDAEGLLRDWDVVEVL
jgi:hypothetical protein